MSNILILFFTSCKFIRFLRNCTLSFRKLSAVPRTDLLFYHTAVQQNDEQKPCKVFQELFSLVLEAVLQSWQNKFSFISHHLFSSFKSISASKLPLLNSPCRRCLLTPGLLRKTIAKHCDISLSSKVDAYSFKNHLVFNDATFTPTLWLMQGHHSGVNPNK